MINLINPEPNSIKPSLRNSILNPKSKKSIVYPSESFSRKSIMPEEIGPDKNNASPSRKSIFLRKKSTFIEELSPKLNNNRKRII